LTHLARGDVAGLRENPAVHDQLVCQDQLDGSAGLRFVRGEASRDEQSHGGALAQDGSRSR
jgi:hypothetical protein